MPVCPDASVNPSVSDYDSHITFLYTKDLEGTARFYEETVGLRLKLDQGACRIYAVSGGSHIGFCRRQEAVSPDGIILTLVTDDVDGRYRQLVDRGVTFEKAPAFNPEYNIYHCFFRDPNGYLIEIQRFEDPRW
jgi:catechol 2,3-dioxygenase-like lactoylglutathione lyase family enzyme